MINIKNSTTQITICCRLFCHLQLDTRLKAEIGQPLFVIFIEQKIYYYGFFLNAEKPSPKSLCGSGLALGARRLPTFFLSLVRTFTFAGLSVVALSSDFFLVPTALPDDLVLSGPL